MKKPKLPSRMVLLAKGDGVTTDREARERIAVDLRCRGYDVKIGTKYVHAQRNPGRRTLRFQIYESRTDGTEIFDYADTASVAKAIARRPCDKIARLKPCVCCSGYTNKRCSWLCKVWITVQQDYQML